MIDENEKLAGAPAPQPHRPAHGEASGVSAEAAAPISATTEPGGPGGADSDDETGEESFLAEMPRLFMIPAAIVVLCVGVFVLFGLIASEGRSAHDYLDDVRSARSNQRWQAAFELSRVLIRDAKAKQDPNIASDIARLLGESANDDPLVRRYLVLALEEIGDAATTPAVVRALSDPDVEVRLYAARALGRLRAPESGAALLPLLEDTDPAVRKMALHSLGRLGDAAAAGAIQARLDDPVEDVRWNAALALALLGDGAGAQTLINMMDEAYLGRVGGITDEQKIEARLNAVRAAWRLKEPALRSAVESLSRTDASLKVRDVALKALADWP